MTGGCPQGSILGVLLFNVTTDDLEDGSAYVSNTGAPNPVPDDDFMRLPADVPDSHLQLPERRQTPPPTALNLPPIVGTPDQSRSPHVVSGCDRGRILPAASPTAPPTDDRDHGSSDLPSALDGTQFNRPAASSPGPPVPSPGLSPISTASPVRTGPPDSTPPFDGRIHVRFYDSADYQVAPRRINYSSEGDLTPPDDHTYTCLGQWRPAKVDVDKYMDDNLQEEKVNMETATRILTERIERRSKHAIPTQNVFRHVIRAAESKGMRVNATKMNMICISDALNFKPSSYIEDRDGNRIEAK